jgi:predicted regulator of Ras-like GTPase activity (Roadblock/LC7/MglB family)
VSPHADALRRVSAVRGIRGAMIVSVPDGLIVAEALMEDVDGRAVAALAASLTGRLSRTTVSAGLGTPNVIHLRGEHGVLLTVPAGSELLVVAVGDTAANLGLARLEMLEAARGLR